MNWKNFTSFLFASLVLVGIRPMVWAQEIEEVSYDDLVNRLNRKKSTIGQTDSFDSIKIHAGAGLVSSLSSYNFDGRDIMRQHNGFQLSFGIDLFSPHWVAEGALRNFGSGTSGTETRSLRETNMKLLFRTTPQNGLGFRSGVGLGTRYLKVNDELNGLYINDSTPIALGFLGVDSYFTRSFSLGFELGMRTALVGRTSDKNSMDLMLRFDSYF